MNFVDGYMNHLRIVEDVEHFHNNVWRHHDCLVVREDSVMPQKCVCCGADASTEPVDKLLFWHTPLLLPVVLLSWPFYLMLALCIRKHMSVQLPLCDKHKAQRVWVSFIGVGLLPFAGLMGGVAITQSIPVLILAALLMVLSSAILVGWIRNPVWAVRFESDVAFIKNVHPSVLNMKSIPEWLPEDEYSVKF